jgi:predicted TIM-barrel fold metal-dependent hydrolase
MIVDVHSHIFQDRYFGETLIAEMKLAGYPNGLPNSTPEQYEQAMAPVDYAFVFGVTAHAMRVRTPHEDIAAVVARNPRKFIGFMALDPTDSNALDEMEHCVHDLHFKGIKLYPTMAHFDINESRFTEFFERAQKYGLVVLSHFGASPFPKSVLKYSHPLLVDELANRFPELKIIIAHLGHPWQRDTAIVVRKHRNVFADVSGLWHRPWEGFNALATCVEWGVTSKLLFGSDYPIWTPQFAIDNLKTIPQKFSGPSVPSIPADVIDSIIHRNAFELLGIDVAAGSGTTAQVTGDEVKV